MAFFPLPSELRVRLLVCSAHSSRTLPMRIRLQKPEVSYTRAPGSSIFLDPRVHIDTAYAGIGLMAVSPTSYTTVN